MKWLIFKSIADVCASLLKEGKKTSDIAFELRRIASNRAKMWKTFYLFLIFSIAISTIVSNALLNTHANIPGQEEVVKNVAYFNYVLPIIQIILMFLLPARTYQKYAKMASDFFNIYSKPDKSYSKTEKEELKEINAIINNEYKVDIDIQTEREQNVATITPTIKKKDEKNNNK